MKDLFKFGDVFQYGPFYQRDGRFQIKGKNANDLWRCQEITTAFEERLYTEAQILEIAAFTRIQPGELWLNTIGEEIEIVRPMFPYAAIHGFSGSTGDARWEYKLASTLYTNSESNILNLWTRVDLPAGFNLKDKCPQCGKPCKVFFNFVECVTSSCPNHRRPASG